MHSSHFSINISFPFRTALTLLRALALVGAAAPFAWGLGGDYTIRPDGDIVSQQPDWPEGLADLVNSGSAVDGYWVNASSAFFFVGETEVLNTFLNDYGRLKHTPLVAVLHAGSERKGKPWGDQPTEHYDWKLTVLRRGWGAPEAPDRPDEKYVVTVDIWLDRNVRLSELKIPPTVEVKSGGEIDEFIRNHNKSREDMASK